jgi:hypothetical protein
MQNRFKNLLWAVLACALVACGGGGGGDSGSSAPPPPNGNFDLSSYALTFSAATPLSTVPTQTVTLSNLGPDAAKIVVSSTAGGAIPSWLTVTISGSSALVSVNPSTFAVGSTTSTVVRVASQSASGQQLSFKDVTVQLTIANVAWGSYKADALPDDPNSITLPSGASSQFLLCNSSTGASGNCKATGNAVSSGVLSIDSTAAVADTSSYYLRNQWADGYPKTVTTVFRTRVVSGNGLSVMLNLGDSLPGNNGARVQLYVEDPVWAPSGLVIWNTDTTVVTPPLSPPPHVVSSGTITTASWHTYQLTVKFTSATAGTIRVYVDGNTTPVIDTAVTHQEQATASAAQNSIAFGEINSGTTGKFDLDWIVWAAGEYTPSQLAGKLPSGVTSAGY